MSSYKPARWRNPQRNAAYPASTPPAAMISSGVSVSTWAASPISISTTASPLRSITGRAPMSPVSSRMASKVEAGRISLGGSGLNSANHAAHERMNAAFGFKTTYVPFKGTGDMTTAVLGGHVGGAMSYTAFAINNKGKVRALAVAMEKRHPLLADVPTFRELGVNWVDGAYRGIGVPKSTPAAERKRISDLWRALNNDPEMTALAAKSGFELVNVGVEEMDAFMKEKIKLYTEGAARLNLGKK